MRLRVQRTPRLSWIRLTSIKRKKSGKPILWRGRVAAHSIMHNNNNNNGVGDETRNRRRRDYEFAVDGRDEEESTESIPNNQTVALALGLSDNLPECHADESDDPSCIYLIIRPSLVRLTGGGWPAFVAARLIYWCAPAADGIPRSRPQPDIHDPAWMVRYYRDIAVQVGIDDQRPKQIERAVARLERDKLIWRKEIGCKIDDESYDDPVFEAVNETRYALRPRRRLLNSIRDDSHFMVVPAAFIRELKLSPNESILFAYLYRRCVVDQSRLRAVIDGWKFFAASREKMSEETGLTAKQVRRALAGLLSAQLVVVHSKRFAGHPTNHIQITRSGEELFQKHSPKKRPKKARPRPKRARGRPKRARAMPE